ncbi:hypothetical protein ABPG77_003616 [Micractinium sp. CCAP 211/92]
MFCGSTSWVWSGVPVSSSEPSLTPRRVTRRPISACGSPVLEARLTSAGRARRAMAGVEEIPALVSELAESRGDGVNQQAAHTLGFLADTSGDCSEAIARANGVPALIALILSAEIREAPAVLQTAVHALATLLRNDAAVQGALKCKALPVLLRLLQCSWPSVQLNAVRALRNMAGSGSHRAAVKDSICIAGALPPLVGLLQAGILHTCRLEAAQVLWTLATDHRTSQTGIVAAGGVPALVALLTSQDQKMLDIAVRALGSLAGGFADVRASLTAAGSAEALERLVQATEFEPVYKLVRGRAQAVLDCLAAPAAEPTPLDASEVLRQLVAANSAELFNQAIVALADLCATDADVVVTAHGLRHILRLAAHPNPDCAQQAARCLRHITAAPALNRAAVAAGAVHALVALLEQEAAAEDAAWALWNLANVGDPPEAGAPGAISRLVNSQRAAIVDEGAIYPLVDLLSSNSDATKEAAAAVLGALSSESNPNHTVAILKAGAAGRLLRLLSNCGRVQDQAIKALHAQSGIESGRRAIVQADGIEALVRMLDSSGGSPAARGLAGLTLNNLARNHSCAEQVAVGGAIPVLVMLLKAEVSAADFSLMGGPHDKSSTLLDGFVRPLGSLASNSTAGQQAISKEGAIPVLCRLLSKLRCECCWSLRQQTVKALSALAYCNPSDGYVIAARDDGVPVLVALLEAPVSVTSAHEEAARCLELLAASSFASRQAITAAGGFAALSRWRESRVAESERQPAREPDDAAAAATCHAVTHSDGKPAVTPELDGSPPKLAAAPSLAQAQAPAPAPEPADPSQAPTPASADPAQAPTPRVLSDPLLRQVTEMLDTLSLKGHAAPEKLQDWEISFQELQMIKVLGAGSFGKVYLAIFQHTPVAAKVLLGAGRDEALSLTSPRLMLELEREAGTMARLRHPNIVQLLRVCACPATIVTEYCARGSLYDALQHATKNSEAARQLTWSRRLRMLLGAARGMLELHAHQPPIIHRDLKSPNLLLDISWNVKVADFNLAKSQLVDAHRASTVGNLNPRWLAPEVVREGPAIAASDVFSFGYIMYEMMTWQVPWDGLASYHICGRILHSKRPVLPPDNKLPGQDALQPRASDAYRALLKRCWAEEPVERPSFEEIAAELANLAVLQAS